MGNVDVKKTKRNIDSIYYGKWLSAEQKISSLYKHALYLLGDYILLEEELKRVRQEQKEE